MHSRTSNVNIRIFDDMKLNANGRANDTLYYLEVEGIGLLIYFGTLFYIQGF